jgi:hypothetical protein
MPDINSYTIDGKPPSMDGDLLAKYQTYVQRPGATLDDMYVDMFGQVQKQLLVTTNGSVTWSFPIPYPTGTVPIIKAVAVRPTGIAVGSILNVVISPGFPTNTQCKLEVNVLSLTLGVLNLAVGPSNVVIHAEARLP